MYFTTCDAIAGTGTVMRVALSGGPATLVATVETCATGLAVDATSLYLASLGGDVEKVPKAGGPATVVASSSGTPVGVAVDGANIYWTTASALMDAPLGGGSPTVLASGQTAATRPVLLGDGIYWGDSGSGNLWTVSKDGGSPVALAASLPAVTDVAAADGDVFFGGAYLVEKISVAGGAPVALGTAAGAAIGAVTTDGANVYCTSAGSVWRMPVNGGVAVGLAAEQGTLTDIAVDGTSVYWTSSDLPAGDPGGRVVRFTPK